MTYGTPNLERIKAAVSARFPDAIYGQYNCRHIGSNPLRSWSQHAGSEPDRGYRGNAVDIVHKDHGYDDTSAAHQAWLDEVNAFLVANRGALELNELIWRKRNHYDHIHTSPWPKMHDPPWYTPPCKGGKLIVVYADKSRGDTFGAPNMEVNMLKSGDMGKAVEFYQEALIGWDPQALPVSGADGDYGDETTTWVNTFAVAWDLDQTGIIDGVLSDLLGEFHPDRASGNGPRLSKI